MSTHGRPWDRTRINLKRRLALFIGAGKNYSSSMGVLIVLIVACLASELFWWIVAAAIVWLVVHLLRKSFRRHEAALDRERDRQAALIARADQEHAWVLEGDERGIYGCGWNAVQAYRNLAAVGNIS